MSGFFGQYLGTVGIELEGIGLTREAVSDKLSNFMTAEVSSRKISITRDASTEFFADMIKIGKNYFPISSHTSLARSLSSFGSSRHTRGYEVITAPMELSELQPLLIRLMANLQNAGDFVSPRAATHFHIGFANNLRLLKNLLWICLSLDPIMYRLGGMGGTYRGKVNLSAYARPLLNSACVKVSDRTPGRLLPGLTLEEAARILVTAPAEVPWDVREDRDDDDDELREQENEEENFPIPQVPEEPVSNPETTIKGNFVQCINPMAALDSTTIQDFWASFSINYAGENDKYHPSRYSGTNFFAIPAHGTIEFRHCNQSFDPFLVIAIAKFLRGTVEVSTVLNKHEVSSFEPINPNQEISTGQAVSVMERIMGLCKAREIENLPSQREMNIIFETLEESSFHPLPEMPVLSHKSGISIPTTIANSGKLQTFNEVLSPDFMDVHNIAERNFSIFTAD